MAAESRSRAITFNPGRGRTPWQAQTPEEAALRASEIEQARTRAMAPAEAEAQITKQRAEADFKIQQLRSIPGWSQMDPNLRARAEAMAIAGVNIPFSHMQAKPVEVLGDDGQWRPAIGEHDPITAQIYVDGVAQAPGRARLAQPINSVQYAKYMDPKALYGRDMLGGKTPEQMTGPEKAQADIYFHQMNALQVPSGVMRTYTQAFLAGGDDLATASAKAAHEWQVIQETGMASKEARTLLARQTAAMNTYEAGGAIPGMPTGAGRALPRVGPGQRPAVAPAAPGTTQPLPGAPALTPGSSPAAPLPHAARNGGVSATTPTPGGGVIVHTPAGPIPPIGPTPVARPGDIPATPTQADQDRISSPAFQARANSAAVMTTSEKQGADRRYYDAYHPVVPPGQLPPPVPRGQYAKPVPPGMSAGDAAIRQDNIDIFLSSAYGNLKGQSRVRTIRAQEGQKAFIQDVERAVGHPVDASTVDVLVKQHNDNIKSLNDLTSRQFALDRLGSTLEVTGKQLIPLLEKFDTNIAFANEVQHYWKTHVTADPDVKKFDTLRTELEREFQQLAAGGIRSSAMPPVSKMEEVAEIIDKKITAHQGLAMLEAFRQSTAGDKAANQAVQQQLLTRLTTPEGLAQTLNPIPNPFWTGVGPEPRGNKTAVEEAEQQSLISALPNAPKPDTPASTDVMKQFMTAYGFYAPNADQAAAAAKAKAEMKRRGYRVL